METRQGDEMNLHTLKPKLLHKLECYGVKDVEVIMDGLQLANLKITFKHSDIEIFITAFTIRKAGNPVEEIIEMFEGIVEINPKFIAAMKIKEAIKTIVKFVND
jgi:hypothetical protein